MPMPTAAARIITSFTVAVHAPEPNIPAAHLAKLVSLGFVVLTDRGPLVTGDGLIRITESE